jgi:homocysteine S-methyltransferase
MNTSDTVGDHVVALLHRMDRNDEVLDGLVVLVHRVDRNDEVGSASGRLCSPPAQATERQPGLARAMCLTPRMSADVFDRILQRDGVLILDGGLGTELERRGADLSDPLWSARLLADDPEAIVATHLAYYRAGAQVATTASYQATFEGFAARLIDRDTAATLMRRSVELAIEARRRYRAETTLAAGSAAAPLAELLVAASVGPYGAMLADGSEYRGNYGLSVTELRDFHGPRFEVLASSGPDLLALETVPSIDEAQALVQLLEEQPDVLAWLSFTCADGAHTRRGDPIEEAFDLAEGSARIVAVGVNCTEPAWIQELVERAAARTAKPIVVYPNGGERWNAAGRNWSGPAANLVSNGVSAWLDAGAQIVGGCCRVGPETIAEIASIVRKRVG